MQIRGGRGYETAQSLAARGERPEPVERFMRDSRINRIFEGSSEIMRLYLAREALDPHLRLAGPAMDTRLSAGKRLMAAAKAGLHYAGWYPGLHFPHPLAVPSGIRTGSRASLAYVERTSRRLARTLFHALARHGPALDKRQLLLGRLVDVAAELYALTAAHLRAGVILRDEAESACATRAEIPAILAFLDKRTKYRVNRLFRELRDNPDAQARALSKSVLDLNG